MDDGNRLKERKVKIGFRKNNNLKICLLIAEILRLPVRDCKYTSTTCSSVFERTERWTLKPNAKRSSSYCLRFSVYQYVVSNQIDQTEENNITKKASFGRFLLLERGTSS